MKWPIYTAVGCVALVAILANRRVDLAAAYDFAVLGDEGDGAVPIPDDTSGSDGEVDQGGGGSIDAVLAAIAAFDPSTYWPAMTTPDQAAVNERAFLDMIAKAEGTSGPDGYRTMFGYRYFDSFADHPRQPQQFRSGDKLLWTSAAGRYQFMARSPLPGGATTRVDTWDRLQAKLGLPDFSPASQDAAALELISEAGALNDVRAGRIDTAINKVRRIWASLPGADYGQPERNLSTLLAAYQSAGGTLA